jgi:hypothetical protein
VAVIRGRSLFWLPVRLVWTLTKAVTVPAVVVAVSWWLLPDRWATGVTVVALAYLAGVGLLAGAELRGRVRSMARGTFTIRNDSRGRRRR